MLATKLLSAMAGGSETLYVDDVFSAYTRTGTGTSATVITGIDLTKGGLIWTKCRSPDAWGHALVDSVRGPQNQLQSETTSASAATGANDFQSFTSTGYTMGGNYANRVNASTKTYVDWTFRKAPKFFDVVTYTGNGVAGRTVAHSLGQEVGLVLIKITSSTDNWIVYHRSLGASGYLVLNTTAANGGSGLYWNSTAPTASVFTVGSDPAVNANGSTYVAYLFAHDPSADGIIQCGSFTTDGSGNATVNHGWSAGVQFAVIKASSTTGDWEMYDTARTAAWSGSDARLRANLSNAEDSVSRLSASGTSVSFAGLSSSATYAYLFIVAPT